MLSARNQHGGPQISTDNHRLVQESSFGSLSSSFEWSFVRDTLPLHMLWKSNELRPAQMCQWAEPCSCWFVRKHQIPNPDVLTVLFNRKYSANKWNGFQYFGTAPRWFFCAVTADSGCAGWWMWMTWLVKQETPSNHPYSPFWNSFCDEARDRSRASKEACDILWCSKDTLW